MSQSSEREREREEKAFFVKSENKKVSKARDNCFVREDAMSKEITVPT